jgi:hypothetical protein
LAKSILVSEETHRKLMIAKMGVGFKSMDDMLSKLASEMNKARFFEAPNSFKAGLGRKRLNLAEVTASGEAIRIELFRKWFEILKLTRRTKEGRLLDYVRSVPPDGEFADALEEIVRGRERTRLRRIRV